MRVLITGAGGFVGPHVIEALHQVCGSDVEIVATSKFGGTHPTIGCLETLDVTDANMVRAAITQHRPSHVIHLAAMAALREAIANPEGAWQLHVLGTLHLANAILEAAPECWLINAGSGLIYGKTARSGVPLNETALLAPIDDYAVTKAAADLALGALAQRGIKVLRMRPFNHTGPGQTESFVVPAFASQVARIEAGLAPPVIRVGNLDAERDFLDVRDVAKAYALAVAHGQGLEPNSIYNIASGIPRRIGDILNWFLSHSRVGIAVEQDPARLRPDDLPSIVGDASRARECLNWSPEHPFEETLALILRDIRDRLMVDTGH